MAKRSWPPYIPEPQIVRPPPIPLSEWRTMDYPEPPGVTPSYWAGGLIPLRLETSHVEPEEKEELLDKEAAKLISLYAIRQYAKLHKISEEEALQELLKRKKKVPSPKSPVHLAAAGPPPSALLYGGPGALAYQLRTGIPPSARRLR